MWRTILIFFFNFNSKSLSSVLGGPSGPERILNFKSAKSERLSFLYNDGAGAEFVKRKKVVGKGQ
jgi:hypothetical protein